LAENDAHGDALDDDDLLLLLNAHHESIPFMLPKPRLTHWRVLIDTAVAADAPPPDPLSFGASYLLQGRSMAVLCSTPRDNETTA
jgi:glycogen operon protein